MNKLAEWNRSRWVMGLLTGGIFALMLALNILTPYICDDFTYRLNFSSSQPLGSVWEIIPSMYAHSFKMNGRLISHGLAQLFMLLPPLVFDLVNASVFTATLLTAYRLCMGEHKTNAALFAAFFCLTWLFMPVFGQVALWQVGAVNYFWALTGCVAFFAPELIRFRHGRVILDKAWKQVCSCCYAFFFGWYNEIASFVGICMVFCLVVLDLWMNGAKLRFSRLVPVLFGALGYLVMLSMPAQTANKQASAMTLEMLIQRFGSCTLMLLRYELPMLLIFGILFVLGLRRKLPPKTLVLSGLFALAGVCANYMPMAASYYPERCMCTTALMLLMAAGFLAAALSSGRKSIRCFAAASAILLVLTIPGLLTGCRDILSCYRQHQMREAVIAEAIENGNRDVTAEAVIPNTPYSGYWGLRDLMENPDTWPNHSMALYYGLDHLRGK